MNGDMVADIAGTWCLATLKIRTRTLNWEPVRGVECRNEGAAHPVEDPAAAFCMGWSPTVAAYQPRYS